MKKTIKITLAVISVREGEIIERMVYIENSYAG
jgi:hypothetical protein